MSTITNTAAENSDYAIPESGIYSYHARDARSVARLLRLFHHSATSRNGIVCTSAPAGVVNLVDMILSPRHVPLP